MGEGVESLLQHLVGVGSGQQWHLMITSISSSLLSSLIADHSGRRRHTWERGGLNAAAGRDAALQLLTALQSCRPSFEPLAPVELHNRTSNNLAQPGTPPPPPPSSLSLSLPPFFWPKCVPRERRAGLRASGEPRMINLLPSDIKVKPTNDAFFKLVNKPCCNVSFYCSN